MSAFSKLIGQQNLQQVLTVLRRSLVAGVIIILLTLIGASFWKYHEQTVPAGKEQIVFSGEEGLHMLMWTYQKYYGSLPYDQRGPSYALYKLKEFDRFKYRGDSGWLSGLDYDDSSQRVTSAWIRYVNRPNLKMAKHRFDAPPAAERYVYMVTRAQGYNQVNVFTLSLGFGTADFERLASGEEAKFLGMDGKDVGKLAKRIVTNEFVFDQPIPEGPYIPDWSYLVQPEME